jgi:hypothetical protein
VAVCKHLSVLRAAVRWAPAAGAALLAAGMLAALYPSGPPPAAPPPPVTLVNTPTLKPKPKLVLTHSVATGRASVSGAFGTAPGPDGRIWKAVGQAGRIDVTTTGTRWVGFRAGSFSVSRKLRLTTPAGSSRPFRVTTSARAVVVGPFRANGHVRFAIKGSPPPKSPAPGAPAGAFFISEPVISAVPAVVLPGAGFWETEYTKGHRSVWLRDFGALTVVARSTRRAWIRFRAAVLVPQRLVVRMADPPRTRLARFNLRPGADSVIQIGPVPLRGGVADVRFDALPGASQASANDPRAVSIEFKDLNAAIAVGG